MNELAKKVAAILLVPKIGMRVRLLSCDHPHHFGNIPLHPSMKNTEATIQEIAPAKTIYRKSGEAGAETTAYKMAIIREGREHWWVYRHQFEIIIDDDE